MNKNRRPIDFIPGIPKGLYEATDTGWIWSTESEQFLQPQDNKGYDEYDLKCENFRVRVKAHRVICQAFYGPPPIDEKGDTYQVDHLDMNPRNNRPDNLEFVTRSENIQRRNASGSDPGGKAKKVVVLSNDGITGELFLSHTDAIRHLGVAPSEFYQSLTKCVKVKGMRIISITNQEVLGNGRNQNAGKQGLDQRAGAETGRDSGGASSDRGAETGSSSPEIELSQRAKGILEKWQKRP